MRTIAALVAALGLEAGCGGFDRDSEALVRVTDRAGDPVVGADVWSHDVGGALIAVAQTATDGVAVLSVEAGGAVTVHAALGGGAGESGEWRTTLAIAPGDELAFVIQGGDVIVPPPAYTGITDITLPPLPSDVWRVQLRAPCGHANSYVASQTLRLNSTCDGPTTVVATATDASHATIGYVVIRDVDLRTTTSLAVPGTWEAPSAMWTLDVRGVPAGVEDVYAARSLGAGFGAETAHRDAVSRRDLAPGDVRIGAVRPDVAGLAHYTVQLGSWGGGHRFVLATNETAAGAAVDGVTVELAAIARPALEHSADGRRASWTPVPDADLVTLEHVVTTSYGDVVGSSWTWHVTAPPTADSFDFFDDVGFPFVGSRPTIVDRIDHLAVSAWDASWYPPYAELRTRAAPPGPPADGAYTLRVGGDAFESFDPGPLP